MQDGDFNITAALDVEEGYTDTVCIICYNNYTGARLDLFTVTQEPMPLDNTSPKWSDGVPLILTVTLTEISPGVLDDYSEFKYTSPKAVDLEEDQIVMAFEGLDEVKYAQVKQQSDGSFTLTINKDLVTGSESNNLLITLGDAIKPQGSNHTMRLTIKYVDYVEPVEIVEAVAQPEITFIPQDALPDDISDWYATADPRTGKMVQKRSWNGEEFDPLAARITEITEQGVMTITFNARFNS